MIKSKTTDVGSEIGQEIAGNKLRPESQTPATIAYKDCLCYILYDGAKGDFF